MSLAIKHKLMFVACAQATFRDEKACAGMGLVDGFQVKQIGARNGDTNNGVKVQLYEQYERALCCEAVSLKAVHGVQRERVGAASRLSIQMRAATAIQGTSACGSTATSIRTSRWRILFNTPTSNLSWNPHLRRILQWLPHS